MTALFMETTKIGASQTVGQIQQVLGRYGAKSIQMEYEAGEIARVAFILEIEGKRCPFVLPCRWEKVRETLIRQREAAWSPRLSEYRRGELRRQAFADIDAQSKRVAWRQILRWVEAQLAMVETGMTKLEEVFLPYLVVGKGLTLFEKMQKGNFSLPQLEDKR